jgi:hypothetical protein
VLTGTTTQTYSLPNVQTPSPDIGAGFTIKFQNNSTGSAFFTYADGSAAATVRAGERADFVLTSNATTNGIWAVKYLDHVKLAGDTMTITGNTFRVAPVAIDVLATAVQNHIVGNTIMDVSSDGVILRAACSANVVRGNAITGSPSRGFNVELGALDNLVADNYAPNVVVPVTNLSTNSRITRNSEFLNPAYDFIGNNGSVSNAETAEATLDLPGGGGLGTYQIEWAMLFDANLVGATDMDLRFRVGTLGTIADPVVGGPFNLTQPGSASPAELYSHIRLGIVEFVVTDALVNKATISYDDNADSQVDDAWWKITKVSEPLG